MVCRLKWTKSRAAELLLPLVRAQLWRSDLPQSLRWRGSSVRQNSTQPIRHPVARLNCQVALRLNRFGPPGTC